MPEDQSPQLKRITFTVSPRVHELIKARIKTLPQDPDGSRPTINSYFIGMVRKADKKFDRLYRQLETEGRLDD